MKKCEELTPKEVTQELENILLHKKKVKKYLDSLEFELECMVLASEYEAKK